MADIQLRFNHDLLVLSSPASRQLERLGVDVEHDGAMVMLVEPEAYDEIYALEGAVGAQCLVADSATFTPARLAHARMEDAGERLARTAVKVAAECNPQHILVELGPCGLPLDVSSKASLNETRDQFSRAASIFADVEGDFDAYFLNGFETSSELKCALMGIRKMTDKPVFASVERPASGVLPSGRTLEPLSDVVAMMAEYGAQVVGFSTDAPIDEACSLARQAHDAAQALPVLVQLDVRAVDPEQGSPTEQNPYYEADTMVDAADALKAAGVQFMRAVGNATPSYTGALVAATIGDSVNAPEAQAKAAPAESADPASLVDALRARVSSAIGE